MGACVRGLHRDEHGDFGLAMCVEEGGGVWVLPNQVDIVQIYVVYVECDKNRVRYAKMFALCVCVSHVMAVAASLKNAKFNVTSAKCEHVRARALAKHKVD